MQRFATGCMSWADSIGTHLISVTPQRATALRIQRMNYSQSLQESSVQLQSPSFLFGAFAEQVDSEIAFYAHDADGYFTYLSPSCRALLGHQPEDLRGSHFGSLLTKNTVNLAIDAKSAMEQSTPRPSRLAEVYHKDGSTRLLQFWSIPIVQEGRPIGVAGMVRDVTNGHCGLLGVGQDEQRRLQERYAMLTEGERMVVDRVVAGWLNKRIARELEIAVRTVESRRSRAMQSLGVTNLPELVRLWLVAHAPVIGGKQDSSIDYRSSDPFSRAI
jgi:PAS domain S-box-containing protein